MTKCDPRLLLVLRAVEASRRPRVDEDHLAVAVMLKLVKVGSTEKLRLTEKGEEVLRALHGVPA